MQIPFPNKKYNIIYADPPWHFQNYNNAKAQTNPEYHYSTMSLKEIGELPVKDITDKVLIYESIKTYIFTIKIS